VLFRRLPLEQLQMFRALFAGANDADDEAAVGTRDVGGRRLALAINRRLE